MALSAQPLFDRNEAIAPSIIALQASYFSVVIFHLRLFVDLRRFFLSAVKEEDAHVLRIVGLSLEPLFQRLSFGKYRAVLAHLGFDDGF